MDQIDVFVQGEGLKQVTRVRVPKDSRVRDLVAAAQAKGLVPSGAVMLENSDVALDLDAPLDASGIANHGRVHVHRCRQVQVTIHFGAKTLVHTFAPANTVQSVWKWAVAEPQFNLPPTDAHEHALQLCSTSDRPDPDTHLGTLIAAGSANCTVCFDLVPKMRVEG